MQLLNVSQGGNFFAPVGIAIAENGDGVTVAMADPLDDFTRGAIAAALGKPVVTFPIPGVPDATATGVMDSSATTVDREVICDLPTRLRATGPHRSTAD
jgi:hypothetical protein